MATTFEAVAREWFSKKRYAWTPGHQKKILSRLENQLFPILGAKLFSSLDSVRKGLGRIFLHCSQITIDAIGLAPSAKQKEAEHE